jgi:hypothetical protein
MQSFKNNVRLICFNLIKPCGFFSKLLLLRPVYSKGSRNLSAEKCLLNFLEISFTKAYTLVCIVGDLGLKEIFSNPQLHFGGKICKGPSTLDKFAKCNLLTTQECQKKLGRRWCKILATLQFAIMSKTQKFDSKDIGFQFFLVPNYKIRPCRFRYS